MLRENQCSVCSVRVLIKDKTTAYKNLRQNGNNIYEKHRLKPLQEHLNRSISISIEW